MTLIGEADDKQHETMRELVERTEGRAPLEALRDVYTNRLHRQSTDFDATLGLRLVTRKLQRISYGAPLVTTTS
jgi:hypothetical protein